MGGNGGLFSTIFGGGQAAKPTVAEYTPPPVRETAQEAEAKSVRDEEQRKLKSRRAMSGTILTSPLGIPGQNSGLSGVLGSSFKDEG